MMNLPGRVWSTVLPGNAFNQRGSFVNKTMFVRGKTNTVVNMEINMYKWFLLF